MKIWEAKRLDKVMTAGRTHPLVIECLLIDEAHQRHYGMMVVKARGLPEVTEMSLFNEFFGNVLASEIGLITPAPGLVNLSAPFVEMTKASALLKPYGIQVQSGLGVGCKFFDAGLANILPGAPLTDDETRQAALLYAFDLLIQNPDRKARKPNCAWRSGQLIAFDFELGFSFLFPLIGKAEPAWQVAAHGISARHVFHPQLQGRQVDWQPFVAALQRLDEIRLRQLSDALPMAWQTWAERVCQHLLEARAEWQSLEIELQRSLQ